MLLFRVAWKPISLFLGGTDVREVDRGSRDGVEILLTRAAGWFVLGGPLLLLSLAVGLLSDHASWTRIGWTIALASLMDGGIQLCAAAFWSSRGMHVPRRILLSTLDWSVLVVSFAVALIVIYD